MSAISVPMTLIFVCGRRNQMLITWTKSFLIVDPAGFLQQLTALKGVASNPAPEFGGEELSVYVSNQANQFHKVARRITCCFANALGQEVIADVGGLPWGSRNRHPRRHSLTVLPAQ